MNRRNKGTTRSDFSSISVGAVSATGRVRDENEDAYGHFSAESDQGHLFIVADGMGGHARGREASTRTVEVVRNVFFGQPLDESPLDSLDKAFTKANEEVYQARDGGETMGTTATALVLRHGKGYVAHVGDSRIYRFNEEGTHQLTRDHTVVEAMLQEGRITPEEAKTHPRRGTLIRAIGAESTVKVDTFQIDPPKTDDRFLLCTDGLEKIPTRMLRDVVLKNAPQVACEHLVQKANERGGYDNSTALVVHVK